MRYFGFEVNLEEHICLAVSQGGDSVASDTCPDPGVPENGKRTGLDFRVGASVQFSCDDNYVLQGTKSITCQKVTDTLAAWSDHRPICRELWTEAHNIVQEVATKTIPKKKKCKKAKWLSEEALQIAEERREVKGKGERERYTKLNAEFQRIARRDKNAFLNEQCKEVEENNRIGRTRDLFKKIGDMKGMFHAKRGMIKDQNGRDLTEAEEIKKRWQDYTEELYKKEHNVPDNHDGMVTDLKPDILECEVKWALESLSNNKASGGDSIPDWKRSVYIPIPKKGNAKESSNYRTIALVSHASKVMLKILQARLQQYVDRELSEVQAGFQRGKGTRDQIANVHWIMEKAREFQKNMEKATEFCFIDYAKAFDCVDHNKFGQFTIARTCGSNLRGPSGIITSPNYPVQYEDNAHCVWVITTLDPEKYIYVLIIATVPIS
ncbi:CUB and sushi domain-containing protein 1 [Varanus komodoensis]|nr:CUB and sushi domain-containing protein 1 [Varanus komodoensis]